MRISIIIPTYNASKYIKKLLEVLQQQTVKYEEIIIVDSSSTDDTIEIAKSFKTKIIIISKKEFDHGETRTKAGKQAKGEILIYLTQDVLPYNKYMIENIVKPFYENEKIGASYGRQIPYNDTSLFGKHLRYFNYPKISYIRDYKDKEKYGIKTAFLSNSFAAYRKKVLEEIGWFKDNIILGEDIYAGAKILKAGYKIAYVAEAKVYHSHSYTIWEEFKRYFDIGVFHKCESWILEEFGKPEEEGIRYVKSELTFLLRKKAYYLLPVSLIRNIIKYISYKLGYNYDKIPISLVKKLSMHSAWWYKKEKKDEIYNSCRRFWHKVLPFI